ncbi:MAG: 3' terminal RNA ribose 2'-O-methyltransferase Hen1 [Chitinophagales bacterium]|nr:3' terminal RNA ribose 2'-O-methyltransferase Hen1 [Chitinophagales bacterium]
MILQITTTKPNARQLGYLLGKHPDRVQEKSLSFGKAHIFFPEANENRCSAVLLLDIDAVTLSRQQKRNYADSFQLGHYVNDRPYVASSFLSTAIAKVFGSALNGNCKHDPALVEQPLPLEITISAVPVRGGLSFLKQIFEPLSYKVDAQSTVLDEQFPEWGLSPYFELKLQNTLPLRDVLRHLYVLIPVMDVNKHYYIDEQEIEKLLAKGKGWLENHPSLKQITNRYFKRRQSLLRKALNSILSENNDADCSKDVKEETLEQKLSLHEQRHEKVVTILKQRKVSSVLDLGCSSGKLLHRLLKESSFQKITGMDISLRTLEIAKRRLNWDSMTPKKRERIELLHGSLTYRDKRLEAYDAAVAVEVIEHFDLPRLSAFEQSLFRYTRSKTIIITTPNREYNVLFENLDPEKLRHNDHRFEWTREEFENWSKRVASDYGYQFYIVPIGPEDEEYGAPSQMAVFTR